MIGNESASQRMWEHAVGRWAAGDSGPLRKLEAERDYVLAWWRYGLAIWCWDRGEPQYLGYVVGAGYVCPPQLAPIVGDIISGTRRVNKKAAVKHLLSATKSAAVACRLAVMIDVEEITRQQADDLAEQQRTDPKKIIAASHVRVRDEKVALAKEAGIKVSTLEKTERALRHFVEALTRDSRPPR